MEAPDVVNREGRYSIAYKTFLRRFGGFPLKVVYVVEDEELLLITAYPLKRARWRERE